MDFILHFCIFQWYREATGIAPSKQTNKKKIGQSKNKTNKNNKYIYLFKLVT